MADIFINFPTTEGAQMQLLRPLLLLPPIFTNCFLCIFRILRMADSVTKRQALLEQSMNKKAHSRCPNTSLDLFTFISPKNNSNYHDDSGYTGLDSTPRPYKRRIQRDVKRPRVNNTSLPLHNHSMVQVIHFIVVIVVAASLCFGILVGTMDRERSNMK